VPRAWPWRPAVEPPREVHLHLHGLSAEDVAAILVRVNTGPRVARSLIGVASVTASYPQILALAAAVAGIGGGVVWLYGRAASLYHRTLGSRRDLAKRLNQVAAGVTTRYLEERFGAPAFVRASRIPMEQTDGTVGGPLTEQVYRTRHAWLQVLTDEHDAVVRFAITVTDPRFQFRIRDLTHYNLDGKLGHTRFSSVQHAPDGRSLWIGARRYHYSESFWFGNPGNYQRFVLSKSDAGVGQIGTMALPPGIAGSYRDGFLAEADHGHVPPPPPGVPPFNPAAPYAKAFRSQTIINTLTILGPGYGPGTLANPRGPDLDYVRVLISGPWELRQTRRRVRHMRRLVKREIGREPAPPSGNAVSSADESVPPAT
jgi:hypothetical protein